VLFARPRSFITETNGVPGQHLAVTNDCVPTTNTAEPRRRAPSAPATREIAELWYCNAA
jgi:hypothetical protein